MIFFIASLCHGLGVLRFEEGSPIPIKVTYTNRPFIKGGKCNKKTELGGSVF